LRELHLAFEPLYAQLALLEICVLILPHRKQPVDSCLQNSGALLSAVLARLQSNGRWSILQTSGLKLLVNVLLLLGIERPAAHAISIQLHTAWQILCCLVWSKAN